MFGYFKFRRDLKVCIKAVSDLIAPSIMAAKFSGSPFPNQVFADAYIVGFIQSFLVFVAHCNRGKVISSQEQLALFMATLDHFVPGCSKNIVKSLCEVNNPEHTAFENYKTGKREGDEYATALKITIAKRQNKPSKILRHLSKRTI